MVPSISAKYASLYESVVDDNGDTYIAKLIKGRMTWVYDRNSGYSSNRKQNDQSSGYPSTPACYMSVGDIVTGEDGNEYIVKFIKGKNQYRIHQKIYTWCQTGALYTTLDNDDCGYSSTNTTKHSKRKTKKYNS